MRRKERRSSIVGFISLVALLLAIANSAAAQSESAAREVFEGSNEFHKRLEKTSSSIEKYVDGLDKTMRSLKEVSHLDKHVRDRYKSFSENLRKLEKAQTRAESDINDMRSAGTNYFSEWDRAILQINDPKLRQQSETERKQLIKVYDDFSLRISDVAVSLPAMMGRLRDLNTFFGADATSHNNREASKTAQLCKTEYDDLKNKIDEARGTLNQLRSQAPK